MILVGAGGQLGRALSFALGSTAHRKLTRQELDLSNPALGDEAISRAFGRENPRAVLLAAAFTAVDRAETEPELARQVNSVAPALIARWCESRGVPLVHFSTDYVFDGSGDRPWKETDETQPLNIYGATKRAGEQGIQASGAKHLIFRTSWVFSEKGSSFLQTVLRLGAERETLEVVSDQMGSPTWAADLARASLQALDVAVAAEHFPSGIYHLCGQGEISWNGFAREIARLARAQGTGFALQPEGIRPILSAEYRAKNPLIAVRPLNSRLDCGLAQVKFGLLLPKWSESLAACLKGVKK